MRNGKCPKCGSATVYAQANGLMGAVNASVHIHFGASDDRINVESFLCTTCGYYENYVVNAKVLSDAAQKWQKVPAA